jgi:hypothetical protein
MLGLEEMSKEHVGAMKFCKLEVFELLFVGFGEVPVFVNASEVALSLPE